MPCNENDRPGERIKPAARLHDDENMAVYWRGDNGIYGLTSLNANMFPPNNGARPYVVDWLPG